jgi:ubiquinol-cytochrome c reductase cytochrome c1 subunit
MAPPLTGADQVTFDDGTKATVPQMAKDVSAFLAWSAEPKMEARKSVGWATMLFLLIFTTLAYLSYRNIWADKKH